MNSLTDPEVQELFARRDRWITFSTYDPEGYPHSVPMGCFLNGETVVLGCRDGTQKVCNLERDPKCSVLWENGRGQASLTGILIRGLGRVVRDDQERLQLKAAACRFRGDPPPDSVPKGAVYIEVTPVRITSWDRPSRITAKGK